MIIKFQNKPCIILKEFKFPKIHNFFIYQILKENKQSIVVNYNNKTIDPIVQPHRLDDFFDYLLHNEFAKIIWENDDVCSEEDVCGDMFEPKYNKDKTEEELEEEKREYLSHGIYMCIVEINFMGIETSDSLSGIVGQDEFQLKELIDNCLSEWFNQFNHKIK